MNAKRFTTKILILILSLCLSLGLAGCGDVSIGGGVIINEVVTSNAYSMKTDSLGSPDWIELYNSGSTDVNLKGYVVASSNDTNKSWEFEEDYTLKAGEYLIVYATADTGSGQFCTGFKLPRSGVGVILKDPNGNTIDKEVVPELETDISWAKDGSKFYYCSTPTPGAENQGLLAESLEKLSEMSAPEGLVISEVSYDWIELHNGSSKVVDLSNFWISDDPSTACMWRFPNIEIQPGEYLVVNFGTEGNYCTNNIITGDSHYMALSYGSLSVDSMTYANMPDGMSAGRESEKTVFYYDPTPGEKNGKADATSIPVSNMNDSDKVRITEVMLRNTASLVDEFGERSGWVEIYNGSSATVNLSNYCISDSDENPGRWQLPNVDLAAGKYYIIYLSGIDSKVCTDFKVSTGEPVILMDRTTMRIQRVLVPDESRLDNISYGIQNGKWLYFTLATPGRANTSKGLEKITNADKLDNSGLWISEVCAASTSSNDWIELYNGGNTAVDITGWYLSDDPAEPKKYKISAASVPAGGYKSITIPDYADFGISASGEEVIVSDSNGYMRDIFSTGTLRTGITSGRKAGEYSERVFFANPTPGSANASKTYKTYSSVPLFSQQGGYYSGSVTVEINGNGTIYYTTDGSEPNTSSAVYSSPLTFKSTTVLKAICAEDGKLNSDMACSTYLFVDKHTVPVVCISANSSDFSAVNSVSDKTRNVERKCYVEYYEPDGTLGTSFPAGFRVAGASTRSYAQKSFNVYLRDKYGQGSVVYPFFEDFPITQFESIALRNAGQDAYYARIRDAFCSNLAEGFDVDYAQTRFVVLYINGKYWGVYDLKENQNEDWAAARYGIESSNVNTIRRNQTVLAGASNSEILRVRTYARSRDLNNQANYDEFCKWVDPNGVMDYIILQTYIGNSDMFNQKYWRAEDYAVRWRYVLFDLDFGFRSASRNLLPAYFNPVGVPSANGTLTNMDIPVGLKKNQKWREQFIERYAHHLNTTFMDSVDLFEEMVAELKPEMKRHLSRWPGYGSYSEWSSEIASLRKIVQTRRDYSVTNLKSYFGISGERMKELFPNG